VFHSTVVIDGVTYGSGSGSAKKHAEQGAAEETYRALLEKFPLPKPGDDGEAATGQTSGSKTPVAGA
jgi:ribonuclease III